MGTDSRGSGTKKKVTSGAAILLGLASVYYTACVLSQYFIAIFSVFLADAVIILVAFKVFEGMGAAEKEKVMASAVLLCFSVTALSLSVVFQKAVTPEGVQDPYMTTKRLLVESYYDGLTKRSEKELLFPENYTLSAEQLAFNTAIPARQMEIYCFRTENLMCADNAVHAWRGAGAYVVVDCYMLPCEIMYMDESPH